MPIRPSDVDDPKLLLRYLRDMEEQVLALKGRLGSLEVKPTGITTPEVKQDLEAHGRAKLNVANLLGELAQPQKAKVPTYATDPTGLPLQALKDGQVIAVGNTSTGYSLKLVQSGNPNTLLDLNWVASAPAAHAPTHYTTGTDPLMGRILIASGAVGTLGLAFATSTQTGIYENDLNSIGFANNGAHSGSWGSTGALYVGSTGGTYLRLYPNLINGFGASLYLNATSTTDVGIGAGGGVVYVGSTGGTFVKVLSGAIDGYGATLAINASSTRNITLGMGGGNVGVNNSTSTSAFAVTGQVHVAGSSFGLKLEGSTGATAYFGLSSGVLHASNGSGTSLWQMDGASGNVNIPLSMTIGSTGNGIVSDIYTANVALDFAALAANASETLTMTVSGADVGMPVFFTLSTTLAPFHAGSQFTAWVSATNTVSIRRTVIGTSDTGDPPLADVWATVFNISS